MMVAVTLVRVRRRVPHGGAVVIHGTPPELRRLRCRRPRLRSKTILVSEDVPELAGQAPLTVCRGADASPRTNSLSSGG